MAYSKEARDGAVALVLSGLSAEAAARRAGASASSVRGWCRARGVGLRLGRRGGAVPRQMEGPPAPPRAGASRPSRMGLEQRLFIAAGLAGGMTHAAIAAAVGFDRSSVTRELGRHRGEDGSCDPYAAQRAAEAAALRPKARKVDDPRVRAYVVAGLARGWSPEQVSGRMREDFPGEEGMRVSHEAVYQALYVQGKGSLRQELKVEKALRSGRRARAPRSTLPPRGGRGWVGGCEISLRPAEADDRAVPGHWEGDLVVGSDGRSCLVTLVERSSRLSLVSRLEAHASQTVASRLAEMVAAVPAALARTLTWDQGCEMAAHRSFTEATGVKVYFCDPHSPWQRGTNENTNGLLRQYFPKGTDFTEVTDEEVLLAQDLLNGRPRKTLGWKTPAEAYAELLAEVS